MAEYVAEKWRKLGRRLRIDDARLINFSKEHKELSEQAYRMLMFWKQREGSAATYQVLHKALCHKLVQEEDLAEMFCGK